MSNATDTREYTLTIGENVRRYTRYRVMLTAEQAEALTAREQQEVDTDPDMMDLLGDVADGDTLTHCEIADTHTPETVIIDIEPV